MGNGYIKDKIKADTYCAKRHPHSPCRKYKNMAYITHRVASAHHRQAKLSIPFFRNALNHPSSLAHTREHDNQLNA